MLATDALIGSRGELAVLSAATLTRSIGCCRRTGATTTPWTSWAMRARSYGRRGTGRVASTVKTRRPEHKQHAENYGDRWRDQTEHEQQFESAFNHDSLQNYVSTARNFRSTVAGRSWNLRGTAFAPALSMDSCSKRRPQRSGTSESRCIVPWSWWLPTALAVVVAVAMVGSAHQEAVPSESRVREYTAEVPKTILELQQFRVTESIRIRSNAGREGVATLVNLNPSINAWYLLKVGWSDRASERNYHLENPNPHDRRLRLDQQYPSGLVVAEGADRHACDLFSAAPADLLEQGRSSGRVFVPLCESRLYLRNPGTGRHTALETATDFVRDRVWGGEEAIALGHHLLGDANRETGRISTDAQAAAWGRADGRPGPLAASIDPKYADRLVMSTHLGIRLENANVMGLIPGVWYAAVSNPGVYVSILQPNFIAHEILQRRDSAASKLDSVEASALCYVVAFDLDRFELGYALGTEHPDVEWSDHILERMKDPAMPGPDGIGSIAPLSATGLVSPWDARRSVAAFTGGFKRAHGAFKQGQLGLKNHGSHYGFIENGVVFSKLQPGLATIVALDDGSIEMKTWEDADNRLLSSIKHARQNGVPLVEFDAVSQSPLAGRLVGQWGAGNWSGSEDSRLRTIRAGAAIQDRDGKRFLIYAVFSTATPSAMARVFQAYHCQYAMLLDMNALEHTYLAVYRNADSRLAIDHLVDGMSVLDKSSAGQPVPRFVGYPDNRDFFYVMRRDVKAVRP